MAHIYNIRLFSLAPVSVRLVRHCTFAVNECPASTTVETSCHASSFYRSETRVVVGRGRRTPETVPDGMKVGFRTRLELNALRGVLVATASLACWRATPRSQSTEPQATACKQPTRCWDGVRNGTHPTHLRTPTAVEINDIARRLVADNAVNARGRRTPQ